MAWTGSSPNQTVQRTDGTRTGSTTWVQADAADVDIIATDHDTHDQDMADMINSCLKKDGGNTATGNLQMGGFRLTNLGAGAARTESARIADVQDSKAIYYPTVGGSANAITLTGAAAAITAYAAGQTFIFIAGATNTGAVTVNVDTVGVKSVTGPAGTTLTAGQILIGATVTMTYDGTQFQINTAAPVALSVGLVMTWPLATVPTGWLECDGSQVSRTTYSALFAVLGTTYGSGDGVNSFHLPNYTDYFLRGFDAAGTEASTRTDRGDGTTGASVGTKQAAAFLRHNHGVTDPGHVHVYHDHTTVNGVSIGGGTSMLAPDPTNTNTTNVTTGITINNTSTGDSTSETRPKNITVKFIILALPAAALPAYGGGIPAVSGQIVNPRNMHTGGNPAMAAADGTNLDVVVTELYVAEIFIPANCTVTGVAPFMGANTNGHAKVMLFNSLGARVAISASTDVSGFTADSYTRIPFTATYTASGPASYYVGIICDDNTNDLNTHVVGNFGAGNITSLVYATESGYASITVPTTFTTGLGPIASLY